MELDENQKIPSCCHIRHTVSGSCNYRHYGDTRLAGLMAGCYSWSFTKSLTATRSMMFVVSTSCSSVESLLRRPRSSLPREPVDLMEDLPSFMLELVSAGYSSTLLLSSLHYVVQQVTGLATYFSIKPDVFPCSSAVDFLP